MIQKIFNKLDGDELKDLSKFFMDVAKGILGVPLIVYLVAEFPPIVNLMLFVLDLGLVIGFIALAIYLSRRSKRKVRNGRKNN